MHILFFFRHFNGVAMALTPAFMTLSMKPTVMVVPWHEHGQLPWLGSAMTRRKEFRGNTKTSNLYNINGRQDVDSPAGGESSVAPAEQRDPI